MAHTGISRNPPSDELLSVERRFEAALLAADVNTLESILSERFFLNDFTGGVITRSALLTYLGEGKLRFHQIAPHDFVVEHYGETGVVTGWTEMKAELQGAVSETRSRFLHVYVRRGGGWRMAAAQGTMIAELDS